MATNTWKLTSVGRAALMDGNNRQTRAIVMRTIAVGSGFGVPSATEVSPRTDLRIQRDGAAAGGQTAVSGRIAVRAAITPTATYDVTEVGLFAQIEAEAPFLLAYWTDNGRVLVPASQNATTVIAGVLDLAVAAAEVNVTVSPLVSLSGIGAAVDLSDVPNAFVAGNYLRATSPNPNALENVSAAWVLHDLLSGLADGAVPRVVTQGSQRQLEAVTGIVASLLGVVRPAPAATQKYGIEVTGEGGVSLVELPFDDLQDTSAINPNGYAHALPLLISPQRRRVRVRLNWPADVLGAVRVSQGGAVVYQSQFVAMPVDITTDMLTPGLAIAAYLPYTPGVAAAELRATAVA